MSYDACVAPRGDGIALQVSVVPGAKRTEVDGLHDGALRVRLAAPAIEGRANAALIEWVAKQLGVPKRQVEIGIGASARRKRVDVGGVTLEQARAWLATLGRK